MVVKPCLYFAYIEPPKNGFEIRNFWKGNCQDDYLFLSSRYFQDDRRIWRVGEPQEASQGRCIVGGHIALLLMAKGLGGWVLKCAEAFTLS